MRNKRKESEGITLIALVVTIIVLLILAGISIQMLTGDNGILQRAGDTKVKTERAEVVENARMDVLTVITDNKGENPEEGQLIDVFKKYFKNDEIPSELPSDLDTLELTTLNNQHIIKASEIYNGTFRQLTSKTVAQLYSPVYDEEDENYNANAMHIGDWVNYDAGNWSETKVVSTTTIGFGGYTSGQSRNTNASAYTNNFYKGWRIWDITENDELILVSAGCPEIYNVFTPEDYSLNYDENYNKWVQEATDAEKVLLGENINTWDTSEVDSRDWSVYKNSYAESVKILDLYDLEPWFRKYIDSSILVDDGPGIYYNNYDSYPLPDNNDNKLISLIDCKIPYFTGRKYENNDGLGVINFYNGTLSWTDIAGVRPLITLKTGIRFDKTPEKIQSDGFTYNKWTISNE